jgi:hypothetical protein
VVGVVIHLIGQAHEGWLATPEPTFARSSTWSGYTDARLNGDIGRYWPIRALGGWRCYTFAWSGA